MTTIHIDLWYLKKDHKSAFLISIKTDRCVPTIHQINVFTYYTRSILFIIKITFGKVERALKSSNNRGFLYLLRGLLFHFTEWVLYKRRESRKWCSRACHIVHYNLTAIEANNRRTFWFWICIAGVISNGFLTFPRLPEGVIYVGVMIHETVRIRSYTFIFTFWPLKKK